ncbi:MAG: hypothetical protein IT221_08955 [Fluviicola sp.]|nr:hypothetical protein [Fluviicola sp.]
MKRWPFLFLIVFVSFSCKKGKILPAKILVHFEGVQQAGIYPEGNFELYDYYNNYIGSYSPNYVGGLDNSTYAQQFNDELQRLLEKNNIQLTSAPAEYELKINSFFVDESLNKEAYTDSCSSDYQTAYVYYSDLQVHASVSLYKNGYFIETWEKNGYSTETVKTKTDACNQPKIRSALFGPIGLSDRVAKELRVRISKKMYELEVN